MTNKRNQRRNWKVGDRIETAVFKATTADGQRALFWIEISGRNDEGRGCGRPSSGMVRLRAMLRSRKTSGVVLFGAQTKIEKMPAWDKLQ